MKLFGTDGIRGLVNQELDCNLAMKIGASVAYILKKELKKEKLTFLIGSDTRISRDMLKSSIISGFLSEGSNIIELGIIPTPAISYLIQKYQVDGGFVISASHNPAEYNGIKVFNNEGIKFPDYIEEKIEEHIFNNYKINTKLNEVGSVTIKDGKEDYVNHLKETIDVSKIPFKVLIDVSNGASYKTAELLFSKLDIDYKIINNKPDGYNINLKCGSTHLDNLKELVLKDKYDLGIAFDGDADRALFIDDQGEVVDGDYVLAIVSHFKKIDSLVGTVMSNLGLIKYCQNNNIKFVATKVGDRYVLEEMLANCEIIGGEQSGHIIFKEYMNTGDGELTALQILNIMTKENKLLSDLKSIMKKYPQVLVNLDVTKEQKDKFSNDLIKEEIKNIENKLMGNGRILVRASGTENLIRIMIEGENIKEIEEYANYLKDYINKVL